MRTVSIIFVIGLKDLILKNPSYKAYWIFDFWWIEIEMTHNQSSSHKQEQMSPKLTK